MNMDLDETIEQIMEIFKETTDWEYNLRVARLIHKTREGVNTDILNIQGILRERLKNLLQD